MNRLVKNIGIVGSYAWLLFAYYFFDWNAGIIMFSYMLEIAIMAILYETMDIIDIIKYREKNNRKYTSGNVLAGTAGFLFIQGLIIYFTMLELEPGFKEKIKTYAYSHEIYFALAGILIFYTIDALGIKSSQKRIMAFQSSFILNILLLFAANIIALIMVSILEIKSTLTIMITIVFIRILIELIFIRKTDFA